MPCRERFLGHETHLKLARSWTSQAGHPRAPETQVQILAPPPTGSDKLLAFSNFGVKARKMQDNMWEELSPAPGPESNTALINSTRLINPYDKGSTILPHLILLSSHHTGRPIHTSYLVLFLNCSKIHAA